MPKKHQKTVFAKPASSAHHSLASHSRRDHHDRSRTSPSSSSNVQPSVNDLIDHLRRTQVSDSPSEHSQRSPSRLVAPRSVHPSLRNVLELPETPPPRPRPGSRRVGVGGRSRRIAGPPPPESWLLGNTESESQSGNDSDIHAAQMERLIYRLERLPGTTFPGKDTLLHTVLKSMASNWIWHVAYDGKFLEILPTRIRELLLSYIALYARDQRLAQFMQGLHPLFNRSRQHGLGDDGEIIEPKDTDSEVARLDFGSALGRWMSFKQLSTNLFVSKNQTSAQRQKLENPVPASWEDESEEKPQSTPSTLSKTLTQGLRFENLRFLSFAHPKPEAVTWNSLITLLSRLSTITHLSLAHWPVPTVTPNVAHARIRHPTHSSLTFSYSGTDNYASSENNWAEAAGILRRLSRVTYCLKWLDLEGCSDWAPALNWEGTGPDGGPYTTGPEWNGSWRDIEFVRLGPGWLPHIDDSDLPNPADQHDQLADSSLRGEFPSSSTRSLAASIHAPFIARNETSSDATDLPWDVEIERIKYRRRKDIEQYRNAVQDAKLVQQRVLRVRRDGRCKWMRFSFGLEDLQEEALRELLGPDYHQLLP